jgi:uncharacterized protein (DUF488 family)
MLTNDLQAAIQELLLLSTRWSTTLMWAEKFYRRCHRRLLSDFRVAQGVTVTHILDTDYYASILHKLTPGAVITEGGTVFYPSPVLGS